MDIFYTNLQNGVLPPEYLAAALDDFTGRVPKASTEARARAWAHEPYVPNDHAVFLELMTRAIEVKQLPDAQRRAAIKAIELPPKKRPTVLARLLFPNCVKIHDSSVRLKAGLRCAGTAIAVERFRQLNGRWPDSLDEIPSDILAAVPLDPIDGRPLRYLRREDGVTIYSIGLDEMDDGGNIPDPPATFTALNSDIGVRLYDPQHRGLSPLPRGSLRIEDDDFGRWGPGGPPPGFPLEDPPQPGRAPEPRELDETGATVPKADAGAKPARNWKIDV